MITLHWLAKRGVIPKHVLKVIKISLCVACAFTVAHHMALRKKAKKTRAVRMNTYIALVHMQFSGPGLHMDHCSLFIYNNSIDTIAETL